MSTRNLPAIEAGVLAGFLLITAQSQIAGAEETLGRLFFTPERRQSLDRQRQMNVQSVPQAAEAPMLTINGMVTSSSGKRTVWVNGVAQSERQQRAGVAVAPQDLSRVAVRPDSEPSTSLKVGETLDRSTQKTLGNVEDARIVVHRQAPGGAPR